MSDPDRFQAWAYRIVVRAAYAEARHRRLWALRPYDRLAVDGPISPDHASAVVDREQLDRGLARLPIDHRAVIVLKHLVGLSNAEIAEALDVPEGTVRSRLFHSMRALRAVLDAEARPAIQELQP